MNIRELINELSQYPLDMEVEMQVVECDGDGDEYFRSTSIDFVNKQEDEDGRTFIQLS